MKNIALQPEFRPALPEVTASKDYHEFRDALIEMDRILSSGIETAFIFRQIESQRASDDASAQQRSETLRLALRYNILLVITGLSHRKLSLRVADSQLFQWFTHTNFIDGIRPVSKSSIERYEKLFSAEEVTSLIHDLNNAMADAAKARQLLYRETVLRFDTIFADTTCIKANIHFPVDWVLLRDAARTLINAIIIIRKQGLKHRIGRPEEFVRNMNKLCIEMTHTRKKQNARKARKMIVRRMKDLMNIIEAHAFNYYRLLKEHRAETNWTELEAQVVLDRMRNILDLLPQAIHQAHERIIGERRVDNADKILSLYEADIHVITRGKAGAEVEFGNGLYLAEQADGLIVDWQFMRDQPTADSKLVTPSIERITEHYAVPSYYVTDRGFDSRSNTVELEELDIINGICPKSVEALNEKLDDAVFCQLQKRRGATEGRIGLFKNVYAGKPLRSKGFEHREIRITWCILGHNLWKLAKMAAEKRKELELEVAKVG